MSNSNLIIWVLAPYICLTIFIVGHIWRYRQDQFTWTTRSTQLLERDILRVGILLFHFGLFAVLGGHLLGILVPKEVTEAVGLSEHNYHLVSVAAGTGAGLTMTAGLFILVFRRTTNQRVAATTNKRDRMVMLLLLFVVVTGMIATVGVNLFGGGYDYRETVGPWFRSLLLFSPKPDLIAEAPLIYQLHAGAAWLLYAAWPFTRLVHAWSIPLTYLKRTHLVYRRRITSR